MIDEPDQRQRIVGKEKVILLQKMMNASKLKEIDVTKKENQKLVDNMYCLCLDFLETQTQLLNNEYN